MRRKARGLKGLQLHAGKEISVTPKSGVGDVASCSFCIQLKSKTAAPKEAEQNHLEKVREQHVKLLSISQAVKLAKTGRELRKC